MATKVLIDQIVQAANKGDDKTVAVLAKALATVTNDEREEKTKKPRKQSMYNKFCTGCAIIGKDPSKYEFQYNAVSNFAPAAVAGKKLFDEIGPRFANRRGGYTRIMRLSGYRPGDGGTRAILELVDNKVLEAKMKAAEAAAVAGESQQDRKGAKA